jgi:hypothetical protein
MRLKTRTDHADAFAYYWRAFASDMPEPQREHRFDDRRKWRFDFAWPRKYGPGGVAAEQARVMAERAGVVSFRFTTVLTDVAELLKPGNGE